MADKALDIAAHKQTLSLAADAARLSEALRIAIRALELYAKPSTWSEDDWGIEAVNSAEYGDAGKRARNAIKRIERVTDPDYVPKTLRSSNAA